MDSVSANPCSALQGVYRWSKLFLYIIVTDLVCCYSEATCLAPLFIVYIYAYVRLLPGQDCRPEKRYVARRCWYSGSAESVGQT